MMKTKHGLLTIAAIVAISCLVLSNPAPAQAGTIRTVVLTGTRAPGTAHFGMNFSEFRIPTLNDAGQVAFRGYIDHAFRVSESNDAGLWAEGDAGLASVFREGDLAPGTENGTHFYNLRDSVTTGEIPLPGGEIIEFTIDTRPTTPALNGAGQTAFRATLRGPSVVTENLSGIWLGGSGGSALVVRLGDPAPGTESGINFFSVNPHPALNGAGQIAFTGQVTGPGVDRVVNGSGIWSQGGGGLELVARTGDSAPGMAPGESFAELGSPVLNDAGRTAFRGRLTGVEVTESNDHGIWLEGGGGLALVARDGDHASGTAAGIKYFDLRFDPAINNTGQVAFVAILAGPGVSESNDRGIWLGSGGGLALVARTGDPAPGTTSGVSFDGIGLAVLNAEG